MTRKPQMTPAQMEQVAAMYRAEGYSASVTLNARHVIAIKAPEWLADMRKAVGV